VSHPIAGFLRKTLGLGAAAVVVLAFASVAAAGSGFKNGGFETGDFTKWTTDCWTCNGSWFVSNKTISPISGTAWHGPAEKNYAAVTDQGFIDTDVLYRDIKIGSKKTRVSLLVYYKNTAHVFCNTGDLDPTGPCNQQMRIDILVAGADPFSIDPGDVLMNIFKTDDDSPNSIGPTRINANLKGLSGTVTLRIAVVATENPFIGAIDDVKVNNGG
jgi:hypothetical protein